VSEHTLLQQVKGSGVLYTPWPSFHAFLLGGQHMTVCILANLTSCLAL
jgi:hypothetical protein